MRELSRGADRAKRWARLKPLFDLSLLKMNSGQLGADEQELAASPISRGSTLIAMMQTADLREGNNIACRGKLYATRPRAVLFEREMRSGVMMILKIARQYAAQVTLFEDDKASRAVEFHHRALTEPYVSLSTHTAPSIRPFAYKSRQWGKSPGVRLITPASHVRARFGRCLRCLNLR